VLILKFFTLKQQMRSLKVTISVTRIARSTKPMTPEQIYRVKTF